MKQGEASCSPYKKCRQCPRQCQVDRTRAAGFCRERAEVRVASACLHFGEEPPVTVRGGSGTIFVTGCTLRCAFCQNYQISQNGLGGAVSRKQFADICLRLQQAGAENINIVTGSHNIPLLADYLLAARDAGVALPFCWNSSAYENVELLELLRPLVSVWLPDLKTLDSVISKKLFEAEDYPKVAVRAVAWMIENFPLRIETVGGKYAMPDYTFEGGSDSQSAEKITSGVIVRHLFLPGNIAATCQVLDWLKANADGRAIVSLMSQYTPVPFAGDAETLAQRNSRLSALENRLVSCEEDADLRDLIAAYDFEHLFYQELSSDTSWLPDFSRAQPFSHELAKPVWHFASGNL